MSKLILVPTPIGNLEDITLRALRILKEADIVLAEDTRTTGNLFRLLGIDKKIWAHHQHNEHKAVESIAEKIKEGLNVVMVSDAGTPGISDPGFLLVRECVKNGIEVECLPGATAFVPALVASGLPCDKFVFEGFLPQKKGRETRLKLIAEETRTVVLYESPHRLIKCLEQIVKFMGEEKYVVVCREISKIHEEYKRGAAKDVLAYYVAHPPKGEIVIIIEGKHE